MTATYPNRATATAAPDHKKDRIAGLHYITRGGENVVASLFTSPFWLSAWQYILEVSYTDRYYLDSR